MRTFTQMLDCRAKMFYSLSHSHDNEIEISDYIPKWKPSRRGIVKHFSQLSVQVRRYYIRCYVSSTYRVEYSFKRGRQSKPSINLFFPFFIIALPVNVFRLYNIYVSVALSWNHALHHQQLHQLLVDGTIKHARQIA